MAIVGRFHIEGSFKIMGRGLMAIGDPDRGKSKGGRLFNLFNCGRTTGHFGKWVPSAWGGLRAGRQITLG